MNQSFFARLVLLILIVLICLIAMVFMAVQRESGQDLVPQLTNISILVLIIPPKTAMLFK